MKLRANKDLLTTIEGNGLVRKGQTFELPEGAEAMGLLDRGDATLAEDGAPVDVRPRSKAEVRAASLAGEAS